MENIPEYTLEFSQSYLNDIARVGGKNASLGQLFNMLKPAGINVPDGFAVTADAYRRLLAENSLSERLQVLLANLNIDNVAELSRCGHTARSAILETPLPDELSQAIITAYQNLSDRLGYEPEMAANGLVQGKDDLEIYCMCEVPSNVILAADFLHIFDGYSIGSNDLTQLILGIDRDSVTIVHLFDERNSAVRNMIAQAIETAKKLGKPIGICGHAPSDYPDFAVWLVECDITSISLNPDTAIKTARIIAGAEERKLLREASVQ